VFIAFIVRIFMDTISHSVPPLGAFGFEVFMFVFLAFLPCLGS
jgi:hypothetical protein